MKEFILTNEVTILNEHAASIKTKDGRFLLSYNTIVCFIDNDKEVYKCWDGYTKSTMKHIAMFTSYYSYTVIDRKKDFEALPPCKVKTDVFYQEN